MSLTFFIFSSFVEAALLGSLILRCCAGRGTWVTQLLSLLADHNVSLVSQRRNGAIKTASLSELV